MSPIDLALAIGLVTIAIGLAILVYRGRAESAQLRDDPILEPIDADLAAIAEPRDEPPPKPRQADKPAAKRVRKPRAKRKD